MINKKFFSVLLAFCLLVPFVSGAQGVNYAGEQLNLNPNAGPVGPINQSQGGCKTPQNIGELFEFALCLLQGSVIPFLVGLALVIFLVGIVRFVGAGDNEEKRESGRGLMVFGIIALFVMVSVWGLVGILVRTFGFRFELPALPQKANGPHQNY